MVVLHYQDLCQMAGRRFSAGQKIKVKVLLVDRGNRKIFLTVV